MAAQADEQRERLDERLAAARPNDTVRGVIFNATFELIVELAGKPAAQACDPRRKGRRHEFFSYPVADYLRVAWAAVDRLAGVGDRDAAFREIGSRAGRRWLATPLGAALVAFTGADPRRLVSNVANGYRNVVSYGTRTVDWIAERHARLAFRRDFLVPPFHCGAITAALEVTCGRRFEVVGREVGFLEADYDVTW
jgi:uncharacterized protein (TIGR02265 family)